MSRYLKYAVLATLAVTSGACSSLGIGVSCTTEPVAGIHLTLVDATTGAPIVSEDVVIVALDGMYSDTLRTSADGQPRVYGLVDDRPATYVVEVSASGYAPWSRDGVRVEETADGCHVSPVQLTARLEE